MHRGLRALVVSVSGAAMLLMSAAPAFAVNWLINSQLDLVANGHTVVAGGPCSLQTADAWAQVVHVMIAQGNVKGTSRGPTRGSVCKAQDATWWLDATSSGQFTPGPAEAYAVVIVHRTDGTTYQYQWETDVQLKQ
jgi:hypothetical protein